MKYKEDIMISNQINLEIVTEFEQNQIIFYQDNNQNIQLDVYFASETFWLSQKMMAELFNIDTRTINYHLKEIYQTQELEENSTIRNFRIVQNEGNRQVKREVIFYNLDAIIAVGYRVNSKQATQFRRWSTQILKEFITKGFVLNDEMLKNGRKFGKDYFDELLERIREIRASERRSYQKLADIFEQCSFDYNKTSEMTKLFYAMMQNKLHYAISGKTAAEIIYHRADNNALHMGMTTWKNAPTGKILKSDVRVAKNYLNQNELEKLNRLVVMFIDFAELQAEQHKLISMQEWLNKANRFMDLNDQIILEDNGKISHEQALAKAENEYAEFRIKQDKQYVSDFDQELFKQIAKLKKS